MRIRCPHIACILQWSLLFVRVLLLVECGASRARASLVECGRVALCDVVDGNHIVLAMAEE